MRRAGGYLLSVPVYHELADAQARHVGVALYRAGEKAPQAPWGEPADTVYLYGGGSATILAAYRVRTLLDGEHPEQNLDGRLLLGESGRWLGKDEAGRLVVWLREETLLPAQLAKAGHRGRLSPLAHRA